jgi:hypothetical protein
LAFFKISSSNKDKVYWYPYGGLRGKELPLAPPLENSKIIVFPSKLSGILSYLSWRRVLHKSKHFFLNSANLSLSDFFSNSSKRLGTFPVFSEASSYLLNNHFTGSSSYSLGIFFV